VFDVLIDLEEKERKFCFLFLFLFYLKVCHHDEGDEGYRGESKTQISDQLC
jgi:hypothetical protein